MQALSSITIRRKHRQTALPTVYTQSVQLGFRQVLTFPVTEAMMIQVAVWFTVAEVVNA